MKVGINNTTGEFVVFDEDEECTTWTVDALTRRANYLNAMANQLLDVLLQTDRMTNKGAYDRRSTPSRVPEYRRPEWTTEVYGVTVTMGRPMTLDERFRENTIAFINRPSPLYNMLFAKETP